MLYLVATPIGNLGDITLRALETLRSVDYVASEDTRTTGRLLKHFEISRPQISFHEHNEDKAGERILGLLREGKSIAVVTDAGTPGISDPGYSIVRRAIDAGEEVTMIPGPAGLIMAVVLSGLPLHSFTFRGFPPASPASAAASSKSTCTRRILSSSTKVPSAWPPFSRTRSPSTATGRQHWPTTSPNSTKRSTVAPSRSSTPLSPTKPSSKANTSSSSLAPVPAPQSRIYQNAMNPQILSEVTKVQHATQALRANVGRVFVGKEHVVDLLLITLLCEGHALLEDVPGIGKTILARSLARSLDCAFQRIQFTPDLLPSDIMGVSVFNQKSGDFEFRPGPIAAQVVLADEINRAGPRTQSALLEAMEERQVTVDGVTRPLPRPFLVLATQNPVELAGTFPLPEAQMDRFLLRIAVGYPEEDEERAILQRFRLQNPLTELQPVIGTDELLQLQAVVREVYVHPAMEQYIVRLVRATRAHAALQLGASPRSTLALYRTAQAHAALRGRAYVLPDDIQAVLHPVLAHRLILATYTSLRGKTVADVLTEVTAQTPVPVEESWSVEGAVPAQADPRRTAP